MREQQLQVFLNAIPGPAALFSREGRSCLLNPGLCGILGKPLGRSTGLISVTCFPKRR